MDLRGLDWMRGSMQGVDEANRNFVGNVKRAANRQIGYVKTSGRRRECKPWWNGEIRDARKERKRLNRVCRRLRKKRQDSIEAENEYQNAWEIYVKQQTDKANDSEGQSEV